MRQRFLRVNASILMEEACRRTQGSALGREAIVQTMKAVEMRMVFSGYVGVWSVGISWGDWEERGQIFVAGGVAETAEVFGQTRPRRNAAEEPDDGGGFMMEQWRLGISWWWRYGA